MQGAYNYARRRRNVNVSLLHPWEVTDSTPMLPLKTRFFEFRKLHEEPKQAKISTDA